MVSAQRLVRKLCDYCKELDDEIDSTRRSHFQLAQSAQIYRPCGCNKCAGSGYKGRIVISEFREMNSDIRQAILKNPSSDSLEAAAGQSHDNSLLSDGLKKVAEGLTSLDEILRVAG